MKQCSVRIDSGIRHGVIIFEVRYRIRRCAFGGLCRNFDRYRIMHNFGYGFRFDTHGIVVVNHDRFNHRNGGRSCRSARGRNHCNHGKQAENFEMFHRMFDLGFVVIITAKYAMMNK